MIMTISNDLYFVSMASATMFTLHSLQYTLLEEPIVLQGGSVAFKSTQTRIKGSGGVWVSICRPKRFLPDIHHSLSQCPTL